MDIRNKYKSFVLDRNARDFIKHMQMICIHNNYWKL